MKKVRLLIADVDPIHTMNVCRAVARHAGYEVAGTAVDGRQALKQLSLLHPDVLLTDIQLPEIDGNCLIRQCQRMADPPVAIACSRFYSDTCMQFARKCGAAYFLYKPIDYDHLIAVIAECCAAAQSARQAGESEGERPSARQRAVDSTRRLLVEMGISARLNGARYLVEAAPHLIDDALLLRNLTRGLYARIAAGHRTTPESVERALRSAIAIGYERGALRRYFNYRPTNREFIEFLMRRVNEALNAQPLAGPFID